MERELALEFVRVTEAAALEAARFMGRGDKEQVDQVAVDAMRVWLRTVAIDGQVVIGEGEMDEAPMLYIGERVGAGGELRVDVAVDPVEGTNLVAKGLPGAVAVLAVAPAGTLLHAPDMYMDKLAVGPEARGKVSIERPIGENLEIVARAKGCSPSDLSVVILDRPRHEALIAAVRATGARIKLISDGDVAPAVAACISDTGVDMMVGIGGAPEGVLAAAAVKCLGGEFQGRLVPQTQEEAARAEGMGLADVRAVLTLEDLVRGPDVIFAATGITGGDLLRGVHYVSGGRARTHSVVMRATTGTVRFVDATHVLEKKPGFHFSLGESSLDGRS